MNRLAYFTFTALLIVFSLLLISCKDDSSPTEPPNSLSYLEDQHKISDEFIKNIQKTTLDSSITQTITWAENQTYVSTASRLLNGVRVEYTSGLNGAVVYLNSNTKGSSQSLIKREANQIQDIEKDQINRHTNIKNVLSKNIFNIQKENIGNKKALIWAPFEKDFSTDMRTTLTPIINNANVKLDLNILTDNSCTISSFEKITDYGLIIIDSHGLDGKYILTSEKYNMLDFKKYLHWINNGGVEVWSTTTYDSTAHNFIFNDFYVITDKFISNIGSTFPKSVIFNGSCESTKSNALASAFLSTGAKTYFGFNKRVSDLFCSNIADNIVRQLVDLYATTGDAFTPGLIDPYLVWHAEFQMVGSPEMAYLIPRWSGSFNYSKNIAKEFADGDQTRSYDINISTNFELDLFNPEDTILFNPFYFEQDSIYGLYEINYVSNFTSPNYSYNCIANRSGLTSLSYPSLAFLNINPEDSSYTFQIMFKVDGNILLNCTSSSGGDLGIFEFWGNPGNWRPDIEYPLKGTIINGQFSGNWTGPPAINEEDYYLNGLDGVSLSWSFEKLE